MSLKRIFFLVMFFLFIGRLQAFATKEAPRPTPSKKLIIASISEGETVVDDGLLEVINQDVESQKRKQIENQLGFLSRQLGGIPELPEMQTLEGMPQIPEVKGKTFDYPGISSEESIGKF